MILYERRRPKLTVSKLRMAVDLTPDGAHLIRDGPRRREVICHILYLILFLKRKSIKKTLYSLRKDSVSEAFRPVTRRSFIQGGSIKVCAGIPPAPF